jgi:hypothetical protein
VTRAGLPEHRGETRTIAEGKARAELLDGLRVKGSPAISLASARPDTRPSHLPSWLHREVVCRR